MLWVFSFFLFTNNLPLTCKIISGYFEEVLITISSSNKDNVTCIFKQFFNKNGQFME